VNIQRGEWDGAALSYGHVEVVRLRELIQTQGKWHGTALEEASSKRLYGDRSAAAG
jgi:hypothetical protein